MQSTFTVLAEPTRRAILALLLADEHSVGDLEHRLRLPQPTVSKHLRVLRDAGFVEATVDAQRRLYRIRAAPLQELDAWLTPFRRFWSQHIDALERHLDRRAPSPAASREVPTRRSAAASRSAAKPRPVAKPRPATKSPSRNAPR